MRINSNTRFNKLKIKLQQGGYTPVHLTDSQFVPTYAGTPLEDAQKYGSDLLNTYKTNIQDLTKLDIVNSQRKVLPGDEKESEKYNKELQQQFHELASKGDYENMSHQVNELVRRHYNNKDLKALTESREKADKEQELIIQLRAKGINPLFQKDKSQHQTIKMDENGNKNYNIYEPTAESPLDWQGKRSDIWDKIKPDAGMLTPKGIEGLKNAIPGYILTGEWKGISGGINDRGTVTGKVGQMIEHAQKVYQATPEYRQEVRFYMEEHDLNKSDAEQEIRKKNIEEGLLRTFSEINPQYLRDYSLEDELARTKKLTNQPITETEALPGVNVPTILGFNIDDFDPNKNHPGNYVGDKNPEFGGSTPSSIAAGITGRTPGQDPMNVNSYNTAATAGTLIFGGEEAAKKATEQGTDYYKSQQAFNYAKQYSDMLKNRMIFPSVTSYNIDSDPTLGERRSEQLRNHIGSRVIFDMSTGQEIQTYDKSGRINPDFMKLLDNKLSNLIATGSLNAKNPYFRLTNNPKFADGEVAQIRNPDTGDVRNILVSKPESFYNTPEGRRNLITNVMWDKLALTPGTRQDFNIDGVQVTAMAIPDPGNPSGTSDQVKVWKVGDHEFPNGQVLPAGYDGLVNVISKMIE